MQPAKSAHSDPAPTTKRFRHFSIIDIDSAIPQIVAANS
jgi:hypothetical protein